MIGWEIPYQYNYSGTLSIKAVLTGKELPIISVTMAVYTTFLARGANYSTWKCFPQKIL